MKRTLLAIVLTLGLMFGAFGGAQAQEADLYAFTAEIEGVSYAFPCPFEQLPQAGWSFKGDVRQTLKSGYYSLEYFEKEGLSDLKVYLFNPSSNAQPYEKCLVAGFGVQAGSRDPAPACQLPGGIALGASTLTEVEAAYGQPTRTYDGDSRDSLTYAYEAYREVEFAAGEDGVLSEIDMKNLTIPEDFVDEVGDTSAVPAVVTSYPAPQALGENLLAHTFQVGGAVYQLPCPVSALVAGGFKLLEDQSESVVAGSDSGWVTLSLDNQRIKALARNYTENATDITHCFLTNFKADTFDAKFDLALPMGIAMGMKREDLESALEGIEYLTEESASTLTYTIADNERGRDGVTIGVDIESGLVKKIELENNVRPSDIQTWFLRAPQMAAGSTPRLAQIEIASPLSAPEDMAGNWDSFECLVNGRLYRFPISYFLLTEDGWVLDGDPQEMVSAASYGLFVFQFGTPMAPKTRMTAYVFNLSDTDKPVSGCLIGGISVGPYDDDREPRTPFVLPGGLTLGISTMEQALATYGEPSSSYNGTAITYQMGSYQSLRLTAQDGQTLDGFDLKNLSE